MTFLPILSPDELAVLERQFAERAVVTDITSNAARQVDASGGVWWDVRPMCDPREHSPDQIDIASAALDYAHGRGLITPHPADMHLVRIARQP